MRLWAGVLLAVLAGIAAWSDETIAEPRQFVTERSGVFGSERVDYTATAGETIIDNDKGEPAARLFSISYVKKGESDPSGRPVTFLFNGGPGSASLWLHMGGLGPRRVVIPSDARDDGAPPYRIEHNPLALLDVTDLVFIDPMGTGFSVPVAGKEDEKSDFYGVHADARSISRFVRRWVSDHGRWNSPKFLGGESYGTTRTAAVVRELTGRYNDVSLNGLLLISTILDFSARVPSPGNEMTYPLYLPTMAATAWYHDALANKPDDLAAFLAQVRDFAFGDYLIALMKGSALGEDERATVLTKLSAYTGLSETYLDRANLRVGPFRFQKELLRSRGLTVGRLDARFTGVDYDAAGERPDIDPSFYGIDASYTAAVNDYLRRDLGVDFDRQYSTIGGLGGSWDWDVDGPGGPFYVNVAPFIGNAMRQNPDLRVFNAAGYYDFATPVAGAEYALSRNGIPADRVVLKYYEAGHMMYIHQPSLEALMADLRAFIEDR